MTIPDARAAFGQAMGLSNFDGSISAYASLDQATQVALMDNLAAYIIANPGLFTAAQLSVASRRASQPDFATGLADTSFDFGAFQTALENNAVNVLNSAGSTLQNALYLAVALTVIYLLVTHLPKPKTA